MLTVSTSSSAWRETALAEREKGFLEGTTLTEERTVRRGPREGINERAGRGGKRGAMGRAEANATTIAGVLAGFVQETGLDRTAEADRERLTLERLPCGSYTVKVSY